AVAECPRLGQVFDVAAMEQIENAVGEHDPRRTAAPALDLAPRRVAQHHRIAHRRLAARPRRTPARLAAGLEAGRGRASPSEASSASGLHVAVPTSRITTPAAWLERYEAVR